MVEIACDAAELDDFFLKYNEFIEVQNELKKTINDYNVITALLSQNDEVRLHSRFIYSLINPKGKHYNGTLFLEKFLKIIGVESFNFEAAEVKKEYENIDLYITDGCQHIIIENKIHAYDQNHQISNYIKIVKESSYEEAIYDNIIVVYLTLNNRQPSDSSLLEWRISGNYLQHKENEKYKIRYINCTYRIDIINWIDSLLPDNNEVLDNVMQAIKSYKEVVEKITRIKTGSNIMSSSDYLLKYENFDKLLITANLIDTFKSIRGRLLKRFFMNIDKAVEINAFVTKYSNDEIKHFSYEHNDCNKWFVGRPRNYNIGTFFKINNSPIVVGLLAAQEKLYFVVRVIGDNKLVEQSLKDANILNDKYSYWGMKKNNQKEVKLNFYCTPYGSPSNYNIFTNIGKKDTLTLLCKKESCEKISERITEFANSLNAINFPREQ